MSEAVILALIAAGGSFLGSLLGVVKNQQVTDVKIENLTKEVNKHNNLIDRTYKLEKTTALIEERLDIIESKL